MIEKHSSSSPLFNDQEIILEHRINDLCPFYEMLAKTEISNPLEMAALDKWCAIIKRKNIPFAVTMTNPTRGIYYHFYVQGKELKRQKSESKKIIKKNF